MSKILLAFACTLLLSQQAAAAAPDSRTAASRRALEDFARLRREDPLKGLERYFDPNLIQHNAEIAEGREAEGRFLTDRSAAEPEKYLPVDKFVNVIDNLLADGDLIAIKSRLFTAPNDKGRVFVDIWRVVDGKFVEHWDVIQPVPDTSLSGQSMGCGTANSYAAGLAAGDTAARPTCGRNGDPALRERSLATVRTYMAMGQQPGRELESIQTYLADDFVQHSPHIGPGKSGMLAYIRARLASGSAAGRVSHTARMLADGELVLAHRRVTTPADPRGVAYADLFRVRNGKIVEHWDIIQPIPAFSVSGRSMVDGPLEPGRTVGPAPAAH